MHFDFVFIALDHVYLFLFELIPVYFISAQCTVEFSHHKDKHGLVNMM